MAPTLRPLHGSPSAGSADSKFNRDQTEKTGLPSAVLFPVPVDVGAGHTEDFCPVLVAASDKSNPSQRQDKFSCPTPVESIGHDDAGGIVQRPAPKDEFPLPSLPCLTVGAAISSQHTTLAGPVVPETMKMPKADKTGGPVLSLAPSIVHVNAGCIKNSTSLVPVRSLDGPAASSCTEPSGSRLPSSTCGWLPCSSTDVPTFVQMPAVPPCAPSTVGRSGVDFLLTGSRGVTNGSWNRRLISDAWMAAADRSHLPSSSQLQPSFCLSGSGGGNFKGPSPKAKDGLFPMKPDTALPTVPITEEEYSAYVVLPSINTARARRCWQIVRGSIRFLTGVFSRGRMPTSSSLMPPMRTPWMRSL